MNKIKLLILDIDGIMTDGTKLYDSRGNVQLKSFCDKDWTAIKRFRAIGVHVLCITGDPFNVTILENRNLKVIVSRGKGFHADKVQYLPEACKLFGCKPEEIAFIGDDLFDCGMMKAVGLPFCVEDSPRSLKAVAEMLPLKGGQNVIMRLFERLEDLKAIETVSLAEVMQRIYELDIQETF